MTTIDSKEPSQASGGSEAPLDAAPSGRDHSVTATWQGERQSDWTSELPSGLDADALERSEPALSVARRPGQRAELATLRGRLTAASRAGNEREERVAAAALARALAARGTELDAATRFARRALVLGEDPALREELSTWFDALGEPLLAAAILRPLLQRRDGELAPVALRLGALSARGGDARAAREAFALAARERKNDPAPLVLLAGLSAWSPTDVAVEDGAQAYIEASERRQARGERAKAFEDTMRAFELAPHHGPAVERLAQALGGRGRTGAADEVRREHARALPAQARAIHLRRLRDALREGDLPRALGAAFDARLDGEFDLKRLLSAVERPGEPPSDGKGGFDELLERASMHELFAARLELGCDLLAGWELSRAQVALARLYEGPLEQGERAVESWMAALTADPSSVEAKEGLRESALSTRDVPALVEALVRIGEARSQGQTEARSACLRELWHLADQRLGDPGLSAWALRRSGADVSADAGLREAAERVALEVERDDELLEQARADLPNAEGEQRLDVLTRLAGILRGRPEQASEYLTVLRELVRLLPDERGYALAYERLLSRLGLTDELEAHLAQLAERQTSQPARERARLALSAARRRRGDLDGALRELTPLLDEPTVQPSVICMALLLSAQRGADTTRTRALARLASGLEPSLRAVLSSVAAELFLEQNEMDHAQAAAEQAAQASPSCARAVAVRARVGAWSGAPFGVEALERAMGVVVPRAAACSELADLYEGLGEQVLSLAWTQRRLSLRPGDIEAARARLRRERTTGDAARLAETLTWLFAQPQPLQPLADDVADALVELSGSEPTGAAAIARLALDVVGPRHGRLREAVMAAAEAGGDGGLAILALERWLAAGSPGAARPELLLELSRRRRAEGDADSAARALLCAVKEGADAREVMSELERALPGRSSDGELALLEARAETLGAFPEADQVRTAQAFRELGAALCDFASDSDAALRAWERALALDPERGPELFAADVTAFIGHDAAFRRLKALAASRAVPADAARLLSVAASAALSGGRMSDAFQAAARALELDPTRVELLSLAERTAADDDIAGLDGIYDRLAAVTLGRYGERAVHYRAARRLERRREARRALRHAIAAFEAVPSEGAPYLAMARLAEPADGASDVVSALERVALTHSAPEARVAWLRRAALFAGPSEEGRRQRIEVLLRALSIRGSGDLLRSLSEACVALMATLPEEREALLLRFAKAVESLLAKADGPEGARLGIVAAQAALDTFDAPSLALSALSHAYGSDGDLEEYETLFSEAPALARAEEAAGVVAQVIELSGQRWSGAGAALLELGARLAGALGDRRAEALLLVRAACKEPEKTELLRRAERAARDLGDAELLEAVLEAAPPRDRGQALLDLAATAVSPAAAEEVLRRAAAVDDLPDAQQVEVFERLAALLREQRRSDELEQHLSHGMDALGLDSSSQSRVAAELAALLAARGEPDRAIDIVRRALSETPEQEELWATLTALARQAGDAATEVEALVQWSARARDDRRRAGVLRELAQLLERRGDPEGAFARWSEVLRLDPHDVAALAASEQRAEQRGDYEALVRLLGLRAALVGSRDEVRSLRLRRASVLEQRLGRPEEACADLEALLASSGDSLAVLAALADLHERLGAPLRAALLWLRASAVTSERDEAAELARRACEAYLAGGDVEGARRVLQSPQGGARSERLLELRVELERRLHSPTGMSRALDELASLSSKAAPERAELWVQAARAALQAGDRATALSHSLCALRFAPNAAEPQLMARYLEYLTRRGPGDVAQARATLAELSSVTAQLDVEQADLCAFLTAEALDVAVGGEAGVRELLRCRAELGDTPLVSLGMGERLAFAEPAQALPLLERAMSSDLRDLRAKGYAALEAARAAGRTGEIDRALGHLDAALGDPRTRDAALELGAELSSLRGRSRSSADSLLRASRALGAPIVAESSPTLVDVAALQHGRYSERPPAVIAEEHLGLIEPAPITERLNTWREQSPYPNPSQGPLSLNEPGAWRSPRELQASESSLAVPSAPPPSPRAVVAPRSMGSLRPDLSGRYSLAPESPEEPARAAKAGPSSEPAARGSEPKVPQIRMPEPRPTFESRPEIQAALDLSATFVGHGERGEQALYDALRRGSIDAGLELVRQLEHRPTRAHDLVSVARRLALLQPGELGAVSRLHDAALRDRDPVYARAVEHVLSVLTSGHGTEPPPLSDQPEQPDAVRALLFKEQSSVALESLSLVWEGAEHVFRRDPSTYGVTGLERVPAGAPTPLARAYAALARALGLLRTPLFQRRSAGPVTVSLALLSPPAVILSGDVRQESAELRFHLGAMLAAATPQYALLFGSPESQGRAVLRGLAFAFGPPREKAGDMGAVLNLAEVLWESIPARLQRRLRELCDEPDALDYDLALAAAKLAVRRAGFFAAGDLATALRQIAAEEEYELDTAQQNLRTFVRDNLTARNLYSLALGAEYAHTRFQLGRAGR
jgi:cellulose synthase operon protein C